MFLLSSDIFVHLVCNRSRVESSIEMLTAVKKPFSTAIALNSSATEAVLLFNLIMLFIKTRSLRSINSSCTYILRSEQRWAFIKELKSRKIVNKNLNSLNFEKPFAFLEEIKKNMILNSMIHFCFYQTNILKTKHDSDLRSENILNGSRFIQKYKCHNVLSRCSSS